MEFRCHAERSDIMSKFLAIPTNKQDIVKLINIVDGFILGIKDFSLFNNFQVTIDELKELITIIKGENKDIFISLNKIIYNEDIPSLKEYLLVLDKLDIDGILFEDIAIPNLKKELNLKVELVWNQMHIPTSYYTCNYWYEHGIKYGFLAGEITLDEIIEIKNNTSMKLMTYIYGYLPMFESSRSLLTNYFNYIKDEKKDNLYHIYDKERNLSYPVYEDKNGTYILSSYIFNGLEEVSKLNDIDYLVINGLCLDSESYINTCKLCIEASKNVNNKELLKELSNKVSKNSNDHTDKGFLYKETIYRVKTNG
jgi:putative protease